MTMITPNQRVCAGTCARRSAKQLARQIGRFDARLRPAVTELAVHPYLADLAFSFPGLLAAIARHRGTTMGKAAVAAVLCGASLKEASAVAGLAWWLRSLPPEAFVIDVTALPDTPTLRRDIANHLPKPDKAAVWLKAVAASLRWGDGAFAVWMAREIRLAKRRPIDRAAEGLGLYAWCSRQDAPIWRGLLRKPWSPDMSLSSAREETRAVTDGIVMYVYAHGVLAERWFSAGEIDGLQFLPLTKAESVLAEADAMRNCLRGYGHSLAFHRIEIVSIRRDGKRVATMSVGFGRYRPYVDIIELLGAENAEVERSVWLAARRWLDSNDALTIEPATEGNAEDRASVRRWQSLWRPYWLEKRRIPDWLPLRPNFKAFYNV
jgi:hypothetical protein